MVYTNHTQCVQFPGTIHEALNSLWELCKDKRLTHTVFETRNGLYKPYAVCTVPGNYSRCKNYICQELIAYFTVSNFLSNDFILLFCGRLSTVLYSRATLGTHVQYIIFPIWRPAAPIFISVSDSRYTKMFWYTLSLAVVTYSSPISWFCWSLHFRTQLHLNWYLPVEDQCWNSL
jgi:hypothetical protein